MITYTVFMTNFGILKGTFVTAVEAINYAKTLGFECAVWVNQPGKTAALHLCNVKPY